jgi:Rap1a immunity proteins
MKTALAIVLSMLLPTAHAGGYFMTGANLLGIMNGTESGKAQALAFIVAVHDATTDQHCTPDDIGSGDMRDAVQAKLQEIGPLLGLPAVKLVESILKAQYPCQEKAPSVDQRPANPRSGGDA